MKIKSFLNLLALAATIFASCSKEENEPTEKPAQSVQKTINITFRKENGASYDLGTKYLVTSLHLFEFTKKGELSHSSSASNFERIQYSSPLSEGIIVIVPNLTESQIAQYKSLAYSNFRVKIEKDAEVYWQDSFATTKMTIDIAPMMVQKTDDPEF